MTSPTVQQLVGIWMFDGTTAVLIDEIQVTATPASTTSAAFGTTTNYFLISTSINVPAGSFLYVSTTVTTTASTTALQVNAYGGAY